MSIKLFQPINKINLKSNIKLFGILFNSSNFSITKSNQNDEEYLLALRFINYNIVFNKNLTKYISNVNINNQDMIISFTKVFKFNKNFQFIDENKLIIPPLLKQISKNINKYNKTLIGIEDIKMFNFNNSIYISGTCQSMKNTNRINILGEYDYISNKIINFKYMNVKFNKQKIEKNWVYFKNFNNELKIIYKWYPLQICDIKNDELILSNNIQMPNDFLYVRGSSCGIWFNDEIWFICHINENAYLRNYFHLFVVFDTQMNLKKYSNKFKFNNYMIEFCIGLEIINDKLVICYSLNDNIPIMGLYNISQLDDLDWIHIQ
jgi:hypothetical protein